MRPCRVPTVRGAQPGRWPGEHRSRNISLYADIGQGAGLSSATGIRPFLPTLLAGALARGDVLLDSAGARIQEAAGSLFAGSGHLFREEVVMSGVVPQVAALMGPCAAGSTRPCSGY